jgi:CcmD family protein
MNKIKNVSTALFTLALLAGTAGVLSAQEMPGTGLGAQSLRPYWHVFIAYTIAIVMVLVWVVSIGRRLKDVEERLRK